MTCTCITCIIRSCTHLLSVELDPECLHANMRLLLSLTRDPILADAFMRERGPQALLKLTKKNNFHGFSSLSTLLFRHVLENGSLLERSLHSMMRAVISGHNQDVEFKAHGPGRRDMDYILRRLGPCITRNKELFVNSFCQIARISSTPPRPEDYQTNQRIPPIVLKINQLAPLKTNEVVPLSQLQQNLLNLLVDHLCASAFLEDTKVGGGGGIQGTKIDEESVDSISMPVIQFGNMQNQRTRRGSYRRQVTDDDLRSEDMVLDTDQVPDIAETSNRTSRQSGANRQVGDTRESVKDPSTASKETEENSNKQLLFSQAAILRLLAELIESYPSTSRLIIESTRKIKIDHQSYVQTTKVSSM